MSARSSIAALLVACALAQADELSSTNYRVSSLVVAGGAAGVDATNATADSANYRTLLQLGQAATSDDRELTSANYLLSKGHLCTIWGLGTSTDEWIGTTDAGVETTDLWSNAFSWGYGVPTSTSRVRVGPARAADRLTGTGSSSTVTVDSVGDLTLTAGCILQLATSITVNSGGTLRTTGTSAASRARIQQTAAGTYAFTLAGTMNVNYVAIEDLAATGLVVLSTGVMTGWTGMYFTSGAAGGVYLDLALAGATSVPANIDLCHFDSGPTNNVKSGDGGTTHTNVMFNSWAGTLAGEAFETNDSLERVDWGAGAAVVLRTDNPADADVATYATIQDAINNATVVNNVVEVRDGVIRDESINLSSLGFRVFLDGAVLRPGAGSIAVTGSGNPAREVLRNILLVRDAASATPVMRNVANVVQCDVLGPFTTANPLVSVTAGNTCLVENSIVGNPASWQADGDDPIANAGTLNVNYSFVDRGVAYPGTNNANGNPQFQNWDPITGGSGLYDIHLRPSSPCVDYAPVSSIAVATDFDRGLDFNSLDQAPGGGNPRRPVNARPDATSGDPLPRPYADWDDNFGTYDVGADELGPLITGTTDRCQGAPLWTNRAGAGIVADPDSFSIPIASFNFSPAVLYVVENNNVAQAGHDVRLVAYSMNDADSDGDLDVIETLNLTTAAPTIQKAYSITVVAGGTQENLYIVADRDADSDTTADAVLAIRYNPSLNPRLAVRGDWATNPIVSPGSGTIGRIVIGQSDGRLYCARGDGRIYRRNPTDGTAPAASGNWLGDGRLDLSALGYDGRIDAEGGLFAGKFNNSLYAPTNGHANEIIRIQLTDGSIPFAQTCGTSNRNHNGFNIISQSVFVTGADQYVWRANEDTLAYNAWPAAVWPWQSEPMGAGVRTTTRAQMFRTVDANVRVGAGTRIYKFRKDTGVMTDDSDGAGDDWGPGRAFRGSILTAPTLIGGVGKDYTPVADGRRCGKLVFGTDQGYCYVASYIRATLASDAEENGDAVNESQPASATIVGYDIRDGRPYPGFPYRLPGVKIVNIALVTSSTVGRSVIVFITDNGWAYGFIEPY